MQPSRYSILHLAAANAAERKKFSRYLPLAKQFGATFLPFAVESFGAFGVSAVKVLKLLRQASNTFNSIPASSLGTYAAQVLAVGLQRGNATVAKRGAVETRAAAVHQGGVVLAQGEG